MPAFRSIAIRTALAALAAFASPTLSQEPNPDPNTVALQALRRLKDVDLDANPAVAEAVRSFLEKVRGTPAFVEIVRDFGLKTETVGLIGHATSLQDDQAAAGALRLALEAPDGPDLIRRHIAPQAPDETASRLLTRLARVDHPQSAAIRLEALNARGLHGLDPREVLRSLSQGLEGARAVLQALQTESLPPELRPAAARDLALSVWPDLRKEAAPFLPPSRSADGSPLPPIQELIQRSGNPENGRSVFQRPASLCASCHRVRGAGGAFGPDLSGIGAKLAREALYEAILDPGAGISFGYEAWTIETHDGTTAFGIITGESAAEIRVLSPAGETTTLSPDRIARRTPLPTSAMPAGLETTLSTADLVDLVAYLESLK